MPIKRIDYGGAGGLMEQSRRERLTACVHTVRSPGFTDLYSTLVEIRVVIENKTYTNESEFDVNGASS